MNRLLRFEITDAKIEKLIDDSTALCSFRVISDGENKHSMPMTLDVIKEAAERSLRGKPILANYSYWEGDMEGHKKPEDSDPIGYVIENQIFEYKPVENGKTALFALALLWKRYAPKQLMSIFNGENHSKDISMEISVDSMVDEADKTKGISRFSFLGLCVLGDSYSPASENARATLLTFSEIKEKYEAMFAMDSIKIDNSIEQADMSERAWSNPGRNLYSKLISSPSSLSLVHEAYLVTDDKHFKESPSESLKFPHHRLKGDTLIVVKKGIQAALARYKQQGGNDPDVLAHIKKHYKELKLDYSEGFDVGNTIKNFEAKEESKLEEKVMMEEPVEEKKFEEEIPVTEPKPEGEAEEKEEEEEDFACKFAEASKQLEEYAAKFAALEEEAVALRKYKADKEESEKNYAIEQTMAEVNEYLPKDEVEKFRAEAAEVKFSEVEAFKNKIKARSLDFAKTSQIATNRMAIVRDTEEKKDKWGW